MEVIKQSFIPRRHVDIGIGTWNVLYGNVVNDRGGKRGGVHECPYERQRADALGTCSCNEHLSCNYCRPEGSN